MSLPVALNCVWIFISLAGLTLLAASEFSRARSGAAQIFRRFLAVVFLGVSLFPCVSVSDDLLGFSYFESLQRASGAADSQVPFDSGAPAQPNGEPSSRSLVRLLQSLEALQVSDIFVFALFLSCFGIVTLSLFESRSPELLRRSGRGPPSLAV